MLQLESERFSASGGIDGRAARRAMGKPGVEFWDLFLRETLQNSWDARAHGSRIRFSINAIAFTYAQRELLLNSVFNQIPPSLGSFRSRLQKDPAYAIVVTDRGTRGLGGVTRADVAPVGDEPRDYVEFIRDIGRASTKTLGGGTYGFGKSVLFDASSIATCVVYSQVETSNGIESRLIATCVAEQYADNGVRYTGRHWWGVETGEDYVDPLTGDQARDLALRLGLTTLASDETGTSIAVLEPNVGPDDTLLAVVTKISEAALRWAWPHMVDLGSGPSIDFSFSSEGSVVDLRDPATDSELQYFVRAYEQACLAEGREQAEHQWPWTVKRIESRRPPQRAGTLVFRTYPPAEEDHSLGRHIALMRNPRFVVKYMEIAEDPGGLATAGVFVVDPGANDDFAKAEPVAHDDWVPAEDSEARTSLVRVALRSIRDQFKSQSIGPADGEGNENASGVTLVSKVLGSLLSGMSGSGAEVQRRKASLRKVGGAASGRQSSVVLESYPTLSFEDDEVVADFRFSLALTTLAEPSRLRLVAQPFVVLDGGAVEGEDDRPLGAASPEVIGWWAGGRQISMGVDVLASAITGGDAFVRIRQPIGAAVTVNIRIESSN